MADLSGDLYGAAAAAPMLTGDDYLKTLPPQTAAIVKSFDAGKQQVSPMFWRSKQGAQLEPILTQYNPEFDATNYSKRQATATAFAKGQQGNAVRSVNQAISHMGTLSQNIDSLNNFGGIATPLNYVVNNIEQATGDPRQGVYQQTVQALGGELNKAFAGSGAGNVTEHEAWKDTFPINASKDQQKAYLQNSTNLLAGAMHALDDQYKQGMGVNASVTNLISPHAMKIYTAIQNGETPSTNDLKALQTELSTSSQGVNATAQPNQSQMMPSTATTNTPMDLQSLAKAELARRMKK